MASMAARQKQQLKLLDSSLRLGLVQVLGLRLRLGLGLSLCLRLCLRLCLKSFSSFAAAVAAVSGRDRLAMRHATCSNTRARPSCIRWSITFSLTWDTTFQMATFNHNDCYYFFSFRKTFAGTLSRASTQCKVLYYRVLHVWHIQFFMPLH